MLNFIKKNIAFLGLLLLIIISIVFAVLARQIVEESKTRVAQLEGIVEKLTGDAPPKNLYSVSGFVARAFPGNEGEILLDIFQTKITPDMEKVDKYQFGQIINAYNNKETLRVKVSRETKILFQGRPPASDNVIGEPAGNLNFTPLSYEQAKGSLFGLPKVLVMTSVSPKESSEITAYNMTIYPVIYEFLPSSINLP